MKNSSLIFLFFGSTMLATSFSACGPAGGKSAGHEYIPDMAHSVAYEANVMDDYKRNHWDAASTKSLKELSTPHKPVAGTVARGYAGISMAGDYLAQAEMMKDLKGQKSLQEISVPVNGSVPYYYADTEDDRKRAIAEITKNPYPITKKGLAKGKELYNVFCAICHGEKGMGNGYLYESPVAKYPAAPANLVSDDLIGSSEGRYYHAFMYGKNVMGAYKDKVSYEERWQVIHYIRALQAASKTLKYDETENTLNQSGVPYSKIVASISPASAATVAVVEKKVEKK